jgi:hypothetical protein
MNQGKLSFISILLGIFLIVVFLAACGSGGGTTPTALDGQTLMQERCSVCHSLSRVTSAHKTSAQWQTTVDRMVTRGAQLKPAEEQVLLAYLDANYK